MQAFTAKAKGEEWVITYNGYTLDAIKTKATEYAVTRIHTTTTYMQGGKALGAFHREKEKALAKGLLISNFDSTVKKPKIYEKVAVVHPKRVKILNGYVTAERGLELVRSGEFEEGEAYRGYINKDMNDTKDTMEEGKNGKSNTKSN